MELIHGAAVALALGISCVLTRAIAAHAHRWGLLDIPNERSSHHATTPRGGGLAIVVGMTFGACLLLFAGDMSVRLFLAVTGGGAIVAWIGLRDDRRHVAPVLRLIAHFAAALVALWCIEIDEIPPWLPSNVAWIRYPLAAVAIVWSINLFNFMDGIDGIAAGQAFTMAISVAVLAIAMHVWAGVAEIALVLAAACLGFLVWNWPPAKIFMGDVGSGYLGYVLAVLAIASARHEPHAFLVWLILGALFFVDATLTLLCRVLRRERVFQPHRSHAYQLLAMRFGSHAIVTTATVLINVIVLLPLGWLALSHRQWVWPILCGVLTVGATTVYLVRARSGL